MSWKQEKFKTLIDYKSGYTWSSDQETNKPEPNSIRVLTVTNIQKELDLSNELYLLGVSEKDKIEKAVSKEWSIAVSSNGNRKRIGNAVFIKEDTNYLFASFLTAFKPKFEADISPEFFFRWLTSDTVQDRISAVSEGTTGLGNLDLRFLRRMEIFYPDSIQEQTAIATILSQLDAAIEATQHSIKAVEKLKKALMQNLLSGKLKPDGTWRMEDEFYEDEKFGKVPKGWVCSRFKDFSVLQRGKDLTDNDVIQGEYPVVKSNGVQIFHNQYLIEPPGVVTGRSGTIGKAFYIQERYWPHNTALYVKDFKGNHPKYIYYLILRMDFRQYYAGTTVPTLNRNDIHRLRIAIPKNYNEQEKIIQKIDSVQKINDDKQIKIYTLQRLKKSLMQHLLTGKVRLPKEVIKRLGKEEKEVVNA